MKCRHFHHPYILSMMTYGNWPAFAGITVMNIRYAVFIFIKYLRSRQYMLQIIRVRIIAGKNSAVLQQLQTFCRMGVNTGADSATLEIINLLLVNNTTRNGGRGIWKKITGKLLWGKLSFAGTAVNDFINGFLATP